MSQLREASAVARVCRIIFFGSFLLFGSLSPMLASNCSVVRHEAPAEAEIAYRNGDFAKAESLYKAALAANAPERTANVSGLVHSLLSQQRVIEASEAVHTLLEGTTATAALLGLRAEVELRQGEPWSAAETAIAAMKLDPCNPRTLLILGRLADLNSRHAKAVKLLGIAHQLDPEDDEIRAAWLKALPPAERIRQLEAHLSGQFGGNSEMIAEQRAELELLKKWAEQPNATCSTSAKITPIVIPFDSIRSMRGDILSPALDVKVNQQNIHVWFDTSYNARLPIEGVSGLLILKSAAQRMGLKPLFENTVPGTGPQGPRKGYVAYAESIEIGNLELHNCAVQVMEGRFWNDGDGIIATNFLAEYLTTIDFPNHKIILDSLPPTTLDAQGDRVIPPTLKDFASLYRKGTDIIVPVMVNRARRELFLVDTAVGYTMLSPEAAHEIAEGRKDKVHEVHDLNGTTTRFSAGDVQLAFAGLTQNVTHIDTYDTSRFTADADMQISGLLGNATLRDLTVHLDLRDGLIKMDFKSNSAGSH